MAGDFIKINRKILKWEWYKNTNTKVVFLHCLLSANWCDSNFEGMSIPRGTFVTSLARLSDDLGLSVKQVRVALNHLKRTKEVAITTTSKFTVITVNNYDQYQLEGKVEGNQRAKQGQSEGKVRAKQGQSEGKVGATIEEYKEYKEYKEGKEDKETKEGKEVIIGEEKIIKEKPEKDKPEKMVDMFKRISVDFTLSDVLYDKLIEWFTYKQERKEVYKETGMRGLLKRVVNNTREYGDMAVCDLIDDSISSNWQGIIWDNIGKPRGRQSLADRWRNA